MGKLVASHARTLVLAIAFAMVAFVVGLITPNSALAQAPTQEAACGPWNQSIPVTIPARGRTSVGRVAEILLEDLTPDQAAAALAPADATYPRLATRQSCQHRDQRGNCDSRTPLHATSVAALVRGIYSGIDPAIRATATRQIVELVKRLGQSHVSIEESWRFCLAHDPVTGATITDPTTGQVRRERAMGALCPDGTPSRQGSRVRLLTRDFSGDFYVSSFAPATLTTRPTDDFRPSFGYQFRVTIKASDTRSLAFTIPRIYGATNHPRPGAQVCAGVNHALNTPTPGTAEGKQQVFDEMERLLPRTIAEGDLATAQWAAMALMSQVMPRYAGLEALLGCQDREHGLYMRLVARWREVQHVRAALVIADDRILHWQLRTLFAVVIAAILAVLLVSMGRYHGENLKKFVQKATATAVANFCGQLRLSDIAAVVMSKTKPGSPEYKWAQGISAESFAADPNAFILKLLNVLGSDAPVLPKAPALVEELPPTTPTERPVVDGHYQVTALACALFLMFGQTRVRQTVVRAQERAHRRLSHRIIRLSVALDAANAPPLCAIYTGVTCEALVLPVATTISGVVLTAAETSIITSFIRVEMAPLFFFDLSLSLEGQLFRLAQSCAAETKELLAARDGALDRARLAEEKLVGAERDHKTLTSRATSSEEILDRANIHGAAGHRTNLLDWLAEAGIIHKSLSIAPFDSVAKSIEEEISRLRGRLAAEMIMRTLLEDILGASRLYGVLNGEEGVTEELRLGALILSTGEPCLFGVVDPTWIASFWRRWNTNSEVQRLPAARRDQALTGRQALVATGDLPTTLPTVRDLDFTGPCEVPTIRDFTGPISINPELLVTTAEHDAVCLDARRREVVSLTAQRKIPTWLRVKAHGRTKTRASSVPSGFVFHLGTGMLLPADLSESLVLATPGDAE